MRLLAMLIAATMLAATPSWGGDKRERKKVEVEGVVTAIDARSGVVVVRGEKGRAWAVVVQSVTEVKFEEDDDDEHASVWAGATPRDLQVGDQVEIKGLRLDEGRVLALKIKVEGRRRPPHVVASPGTFIRGVVIAISNGQFIIVAQDHNVTVVISSTTRFVKNARPFSARRLGKHDVVIVRGELAGDRLDAEEVEVEFGAEEGIVLRGFVGVLWLQGGAFLLAGMPVWINVTSRTFIIHNEAAATFGIIQPNASIVVYGRGRGTATQAMVIVVR